MDNLCLCVVFDIPIFAYHNFLLFTHSKDTIMGTFRNFASNMKEYNGKAATVLYSYNTPVAAFVLGGRAFLRTDAYFSRTTSRHITKWLKHYEQRGLLLGREVRTVPHAMIESLTV